MNKRKQYSLLLQDPRWKKKRLVILKRDNNQCRHCESKENLHVHHLVYQVGKVPPWEYRNSDLITLCANCHNEVHRTTKIKFVDRKNKKVNRSKKDRIKTRIDNMKNMLSPKDLELQKRYDKINPKIS